MSSKQQQKQKPLKCPNGCGPMHLARKQEKILFRGVSLKIIVEGYACDKCNIKNAGTIKQCEATQKEIIQKYYEKTGKRIILDYQITPTKN